MIWSKWLLCPEGTRPESWRPCHTFCQSPPRLRSRAFRSLSNCCIHRLRIGRAPLSTRLLVCAKSRWFRWIGGTGPVARAIEASSGLRQGETRRDRGDKARAAGCALSVPTQACPRGRARERDPQRTRLRRRWTARAKNIGMGHRQCALQRFPPTAAQPPSNCSNSID